MIDKCDNEETRLVEENMPLAIFMARKALDLDYNDAFSCAMNGLWKASRAWIGGVRYKACSKRFGTFAGLHIRSEIASYRRYLRRAVRGGGVAHVSLEAKRDPFSKKSESIGESIPDGSSIDFVTSVEHKDAISCSEALMSVLSERERQIIEMRFGLNGNAMSRSEVARHFGFSSERVRQIEVFSLNRLREAWECLDLCGESGLEHLARDARKREQARARRKSGKRSRSPRKSRPRKCQLVQDLDSNYIRELVARSTGKKPSRVSLDEIEKKRQQILLLRQQNQKRKGANPKLAA